MDNPEIVYMCYSRAGMKDLESARFEKLYFDSIKCKQWINKKNSQAKRYYFWIAERVSD